MTEISNARRVVLAVTYNNKGITRELAKDLQSFTFNDAESGNLDDIQIDVSDKNRNWSNSWFPTASDQINCQIKVLNWDKPGDNRVLKCGFFEVDSVELKGMPDLVSIKALSIPAGATSKQTKRTKAWENFTLKSIASEIARSIGFSLSYNVPENPKYEREEQTDVTDLAFLNDLCIKEGLSLKITGKKLVIFDEFEFEKRATSFTIERGKSNLLDYSFGFSTQSVAYVACELTYQEPVKKAPTKKKETKKDSNTDPKTVTTTKKKKENPKKKEKAAQPKNVTVVYRPPGAPANGPVLKVNQSVKSPSEALRMAKNALREKNKESGKASINLMGDIRFYTGLTIQLKGFGKFDGKYIVVSASHAISSSGYVTGVEIRKVLGW